MKANNKEFKRIIFILFLNITMKWRLIIVIIFIKAKCITINSDDKRGPNLERFVYV